MATKKRTSSKKKASTKRKSPAKVLNGAPKRKTNGAPMAKSAPTKPKKARASSSDTPASGGVGVGDTAPAFDLVDHANKPISSKLLAGKSYVLYFYPKDDTPGCTTEACGFRDELPKFKKGKVLVIGVSPDSPSSHAKFRDKYQLPFTLVSDPEKALIKAYGVWVKKVNYGREYMGVERSTFLIDARGRVKQAWRRVKVPGHVEKVLEATKALDS